MSKIGSSTGASGQIVSANHENVYRELLRADETNYFGHLYRTRTQRLDAALPFVRAGLQQGERCLYVTGASRETIIEELSALDIDVSTARSQDQLQIVSQTDADGEAFFGRLARLLDENDDATENVRVVVDIPWGKGHAPGFEEFIQHRTGSSSEIPDGTLILCQHAIHALDEPQVIDIAQLYPKLVYRGQICDNPYYESPDGEVSADGPTVTIDEILGTAHDLAAARDAIQQREQRVAVLNRVLRHNLRNEMNVVRTHAELIEDNTDDSEIRESVATIRETTGRLLDIAEDARRVQQIAADGVPERRPVELDTTVEHAATRTRNQYPGIEINWSVDGTWVEGTEHLDVGLTELFKRLAETADEGCRISLQHNPSCGSPGHQCLRIDCDGSGLPDAEIESLSNGIETQLTHGSGLGLWLANWIVNLSGGRLTFEEDGSTAIVSLPAAGDST